MGFYEADILAGVSDIDFLAQGYEEEPIIRIRVKPFKYFDFLATNANIKLRNDLEPEDRAILKRYVEKITPYKPVTLFANPLSVEVLLLCEDGRKCVLQKRSSKTVYRGGLLAPSVSETVSYNRDKVDENRLDVFKTIVRGLKEELGLDEEYVDNIYVTSLLFDREIFDYHLTAIAITFLDEESILSIFKSGKPKDKHEYIDLQFIDFPMEKIDLNKIHKTWVPETIASYVLGVVDRYGWRRLERMLNSV